MTYEEFLLKKSVLQKPAGFEPESIYAPLFDWQKSVTVWATRLGKAALFEECGLGKTAQQLEWARQVHKHTGCPVLILAPLAVSAQTKREGVKFGISTKIVETDADVINGINITNYEKLQKFDVSRFAGIVLDESSILKAYTGKTKRLIVDSFKNTPYRLACSATPAPNDLMELLNHAEFLGIMRSSEALSVWFIADQSKSGKYRLKGHAEKDFWQWVASWAVCMDKPSDIGYSDDGYVLPELHEYDVIVGVSEISEDLTNGFLREIELSATGFYKEKAITSQVRAEKCAEIATKDSEQYLIWCGTNDEADKLKKLLPEAVEIRGNDKAEVKERAALDFIDGNTRVLISKPSIFGYGLNFQNCANAIFCGLDYSFESYYQAVRRLHRFGQTRPVNIYRVIGSTEKNILQVIVRKEKQKRDMTQSMAQAMRTAQIANIRGHKFKLNLEKQEIHVPEWLRSDDV